MAKRKPAGRASSSRGKASSGKRTTKRSGAAARRTSARKTRAAAGRKSGVKPPASTRKRTPKGSSARKPAAGRKSAAAGRKQAAIGRKTQAAARGTQKAVTRAGTSTKKTVKAPAKRPAAKTLPRRESAARLRQIERDRREIEATLPMPPSTLDLDRQPSAARTGRAEMAEAFSDHNAAGPAITAGDVDADWASAYSTGDEAPGGDMPTPDQDVVEEIGTALGVQYNDDEELKGANKIERRDRHRWELDPASSEDYQNRSRQK